MTVLLMKFNKPFKTCLGKDVVYNFINSMIEESKYCSNMMKKHVNKELVNTKQDNEDLKTLCWICDNDRVDNDVKVSVHCHITEKNRSSSDRNCNINVKLNHKTAVVFHNVKEIMVPILLCKN